MKRRGPQGEGLGGGPFRKRFNKEDAVAQEKVIKDAKNLQDIKKELQSEGKIGFQLPENMRDGEVLEEFTKLKQYGFKEENYKDIVLYSVNLGVLKFIGSSEHPFSRSKTLLHWQNEEKTSDVTVCFDSIKQEVTLFSISENHRTKNTAHEKTDKKPQTELMDPNAEALENMRKKIEAEGKISVELPENTMPNDNVELFENAMELKTNPRDIVFYSFSTGILRYTGYGTNASEKQFFYRYRNDVQTILLTILLDKKASSARVFKLSKPNKSSNTIK